MAGCIFAFAPGLVIGIVLPATIKDDDTAITMQAIFLILLPDKLFIKLKSLVWGDGFLIIKSRGIKFKLFFLQKELFLMFTGLRLFKFFDFLLLKFE